MERVSDTGHKGLMTGVTLLFEDAKKDEFYGRELGTVYETQASQLWLGLLPLRNEVGIPLAILDCTCT